MDVQISSIDLAIVGVYLLAVVFFGLWIGRGNKDITQYAVGDRNLPWWLILASIVATETSTVTFLSVPGLSYNGNLSFLQLPIGYILGRYLVSIVLLPYYFQGAIFTAYEVLEKRFGGLTKKVASLLFVVMRSLADGLRLYLTALVLQAMTHMPMSYAIITIGVATIVYTFFGGMKAVVWTDFVQFLIYIFGAVLAGSIIVRSQPGGLAYFYSAVAETEKLNVFDFSLDYRIPYTFAAGLIGGAFLTFATHGTDQLTVQRLLSAPNERTAARALQWSGWVVFAQFLLFLLLGTGLWVFYKGRDFATADAVMATFIVEEMPVGIVGITLAAVFAAAMSTLSSSLNSSATATVNDLLTLIRTTPNSDVDEGDDTAGRRAMWQTQVWTCVFGIVQMGVALVAASVGLQRSVVDLVLAIAGFASGITLGVFFLGVFCKHVQQKAALVGMVGGTLVLLVIKFATVVAWPWFAVVGSLSVVAIGLASQRVIGKEI